MITVNKVQVPINAEQDNNKNKTTWLNGKYVSLDEGPAVTLFIGHTKETVVEADGREMEIALAFPVSRSLEIKPSMPPRWRFTDLPPHWRLQV